MNLQVITFHKAKLVILGNRSTFFLKLHALHIPGSFPSSLRLFSALKSIWEGERGKWGCTQMPLLREGIGFYILHSCRRTVSMETGCQNIQLCSTILNVTFPPEVIGPLFLSSPLYDLPGCRRVSPGCHLPVLWENQSFQGWVVNYSPWEICFHIREQASFFWMGL